MIAKVERLSEDGRATVQPWSFFLFRESPWLTSITGFALGIGLLTILVSLELLSGRPMAVLSGVPQE